MMGASDGGVVLGDRRPGDPPLPDELELALREWGAFAAATARVGGPVEREMVRSRGRLLAARVAGLRGRPVDFVDPTDGTVESVPGGPSVRLGALRGRAASVLRLPGPALDPSPAPVGPTPWATGLSVAAFFAVLVALADIVLSRAFAEAFGLWWLPANLLIGLGLAPSLHLLRDIRFWRWIALGTAVGLVGAWLILLVSLLG